MKPLLSIVIPTKDRYRTLINLVDYLLTWNSDEFEVIIQDNSNDNKPLKVFLENHKEDTRLKYFHEKNKVLSVVENSTRSIENSTGKYVCFLGDDDGIIKQSLSVVKWMDANQIDSLNCSHGSYCWPEYRLGTNGKKKSLAGMLLYHGYTGAVKKVNPIDSLSELLENGALRINTITRVYHGIVSRETLEKLKTKTGFYFPGPVADMSSAVGLSFYSKNHYTIDYPLITAGASGSSFAGKSGQKKNSIILEDQAWLPKDTIDNWSSFLPKYLTVHTIWPESAVHALLKTGNEKWIQKLNLDKIYAEYLVDYPELKADFDVFLNEKFTTAEIVALYARMKKYTKKYKISKLRYLVKVYAVFFNFHTMVKLKKIQADTIGEALVILEKKTENYNWNILSPKFASILKY
jgi:glycosyltransferase involved in cell wall biosynthesis